MNDESADLRKMLMKRLIEDTEFRKSFVQDPRSALDTLAGAPLPSHVVVTATESDGSITVSFTADPDAELSEADLATVGGGTGIWFDGYRAFWDENENQVFDVGTDKYIF
ncbi:MAG: hypothetical protein RJB01_1536 [Actinomycetota bacterium]|jgi:hypothetical protein